MPRAFTFGPLTSSSSTSSSTSIVAGHPLRLAPLALLALGPGPVLSLLLLTKLAQGQIGVGIGIGVVIVVDIHRGLVGICIVGIVLAGCLISFIQLCLWPILALWLSGGPSLLLQLQHISIATLSQLDA